MREIKSVIKILNSETRNKTGNLDLSYCNLQEIPKEIGEMHWLKNLDLYSNNIKKIENLETLTNLQGLSLSHNQITEITGLEDLTKLERLFLSNNKIKKITGLEKLQQLNILDLSCNDISKIEKLEKLYQLNTLVLNENKIKIIEGLESLTHLKGVGLQNNLIQKLEGLNSLNLLELFLSNNKIKEIEEFNFVKKHPKLYINANNNPFEKAHQIVLKPNVNHNTVIVLTLVKLVEAKDNGIDGFLPVKILMMGNHGSGKSSLVHYLKHDNLNYNGDTTHILKIEDYKKQENGLPMAYFYDFGGQDFYHGLYQAFLREGLMTVMLWNESSNYNKPDKDSIGRAIRHYKLPYWLGQWKRRIDGSLILVQSQKDGPNSKRSYSDEKYSINEEFYVSLKKQVRELDPKSYQAATLNYLKQTIDEYINLEQNTQAGKGKISKKYYDFIVYIQIEADKLGSQSMNINDLKPHYKDVDDTRFDSEIEQLVLSGIILKYRDTVWLNPAAVVKKVHDVLSKELIGKESVSEDEINTIIKDEDLIGLLKDQRVIFKHEHGKNGPEYIIPNYLPLIESSGVDYDLMVFGLDNPLFILKYEDFMPFGLINHLICHFGQLPDRKKFWRDQLLFTISKNEGDNLIHQAKILIKLNFDELKLEVYAHFDKTCDNESFRDLVKEYLFYSILSFDDPYFSLPPFELFKTYMSEITYFVNDDKNDDAHIISFCLINDKAEDECVDNELHNKHLNILKNNIYVSLDNKSYVKYTNLLSNKNSSTIKTYHEDLSFYREQPAYPYQPFTPHKIEKMKKVFISYSKDDLSYVNKFLDHLSALKIDKIIETWYCTELVAGGKWNSDIQHNFDKSDIVIFMISSNFMRTPYIHEYEIKNAFEKADKDDGIRIIPIVIDFCDWKTQENDLTQYSALPYKLRPVCDFKNQNMAWYSIVTALKIMINKDIQPKGDEWYRDNLPQDLRNLYERIVAGNV